MRKIPNFDLNNKESYGINVIGSPDSVSALLVMKLTKEDAESNLKHWIAYYKNISDSDQKLFSLNGRLISLPSKNLNDYYKVTLFKREFNKSNIKVPENVFPKKSPSGEVAFSPTYYMVDEPAKIVIQTKLLFNWGHYINIPLPMSSIYLYGIPTNMLGINRGFDCSIQLDKMSFDLLTLSNAIEVNSVFTRSDLDNVRKSLKTSKQGV